MCRVGLRQGALWVNGCLYLRLLCTPLNEQKVLWACKNKCFLQRHSFYFEQGPFQLMQTLLSYRRAKNRQTDKQMAFQLYIVDGNMGIHRGVWVHCINASIHMFDRRDYAYPCVVSLLCDRGMYSTLMHNTVVLLERQDWYIHFIFIECRVLIEGDPSISRAHAKLCVQLDGTVFITDLSKYGTSVNNRKLNKEQRYQLKEGDLIKFGNQPNKSEFRLILSAV